MLPAVRRPAARKVPCTPPPAPAVGVHEAKLDGEKLAAFRFWAHLLGGIGMGAFMGMAGSLLLVGFLAFFYYIVMSLGVKGVIGIFTPSKLDTTDPVPAA